ncbi:acyltransferase [Metabacillus idriensis]|uniref:acyltransferase n=1 Tax=Metabacillus idriensis TaxID=324768 RepID=UPI002812E254|nr:acyltransferase [Metabacillus idriensis]MDR0138853.1 acyltransferase [Metabacillus idriensis]
MIKKIALKIFVKPLVRLFYSGKYLKGQYFERSNGGWYWGMRGILWQKIIGINRHVPWPVSPFIIIPKPQNVIFDVDDINIFQTNGTYFQTNFGGKIIIGKGTHIAPNVGLITSNHDLINPDEHLEPKDIVIGKKCWIGMNSVVLPGVKLGDHTVVAAGAVVTKSFESGWCVVGGVPAKIIKTLEYNNKTGKDNE